MTTPLITRMIQSLEKFSLPPMITLDVTNVCNLHCIHCPYSEIEARDDFKVAHFPWESFNKIVDELSHHDQPCLLRFVGDGEPMLHPNLVEMVELAKQRTGCTVNLTTNGTLLSHEKIERLFDADIDIIDVSLDGLSKPVYETVRKKSSFEKVMFNMFTLLQIKRRKNPRTKIMVSFVKQNENQVETEWFVRFWTPLVDTVMVRDLHSALGRIKQLESATRNSVSGQERYPCPHLWKRLVIDSSGRVKFCASDWGDATMLGQIETSSLKSLWQGQMLKELRSQHLEGRIADNTACSKCTDWASCKWDWGYERLVDKLVMGKPTLAPSLPILP
jgi:radical SAM protein with 4Fe4S-binding SPASM domain